MRSGWTVRVVVALASVDAGEPPGEDLCFALVAVSAVPVLAFVLTLAGQIGPAPVLAFPLVSPDLAAPPPRA